MRELQLIILRRVRETRDQNACFKRKLYISPAVVEADHVATYIFHAEVKTSALVSNPISLSVEASFPSTDTHTKQTSTDDHTALSSV